MQYLVEGQPLSASGDCSCWVNIQSKCVLCNAKGCGSNSGGSVNEPCPSHCYGKTCYPRADPAKIKKLY
ncbi:Uncharacterised protein [Clostridium putrefaciens]|uniref:Uncharacterized protein n=1 Tax=Clostridium putrefaciens TaxID=99675 RepID=A0A381J6L5_9CLOT|nr:hypothetical protein [Clostridium putrefaciens]SUY46881.1 Uncharacterised protein [Clostridium putrefaciens]